MKYNVDKISNRIKKQKIFKKVIKEIVCLILVFLFIINAFLLYYGVAGKSEQPHIFGTYFFNIISGSMEPNLQINDIVAVKACEISELRQEDIITFEHDGEVISHRIIRIINSGDEVRFITKGDNNKISDNFNIDNEKIYGKVIFKIPKIGGFVRVIQEENGLLKTISLLLIGFIIYRLKDNKKSDRKLTRKKYEIKSIRDNYNDEMQKERQKIEDGEGRKS